MLLLCVSNTLASMTIINQTGYRLYVTLDQVSTLYHEILEDGEIMHRNTGAVHFTVTATVVAPDFTKPSTIENILRTVGHLASAYNDPQEYALDVFKQQLAGKERSHTYLSDATWYAGYNHILSIWGGVDCPLSIYSCVNERYYPKKIYDYVKGTDICAKFNVNNNEGKYKL
jgi:hypothetical protein